MSFETGREYKMSEIFKTADTNPSGFQMSDLQITIDGCLSDDIMSYVSCDADIIIKEKKISVEQFIHDIETKLNQPAGLKNLKLCIDWWGQKYRILNVEGLSNRAVCHKIYAFYNHKTYRRMMGDHRWIEGWFIETDEKGVYKTGYGS
jgi:hypothetical protein